MKLSFERSGKNIAAPPASVSARRTNRILFLALCGEFDIHNVSPLQEAIQGGLSDFGVLDIVADMEGVPFMDSTGYRVFLQAALRLKPRGGRIHLHGCQPIVKRILDVSTLNRVFVLHDTAESARTAASII